MKQYEVSKELVEAIQARQLEINGLKNLWGFAVSTKEYDIPQEKIQKIEEDIAIKNYQLEYLKDKVKDFIEDEDLKNKPWNLDFATYKVTVDE